MIALDATYSVGSNLSGVGVYSAEILGGVTAAHPRERFQFCYRAHRYLEARREPLPANASRFLLHDRWRTPSRADLFHGLNQRMPAGKLRRRVCTFHDLFVMTSDYATAEFRERFTTLSREAAARADLIIAVSHFTGRQVRELLGVEEAKVRVVYHGVRPAAPSGTAREPMVLHVGAIQTRKNIVRLIAAFEHMGTEWRLVLAGSHGYGAEEILARIAESPARERIELTGFIPDEGRARLYDRAWMLVFPSLGEGFGMPVLEAMAAGVPVVCSSTTAVGEVAGAAAMLVDPEDEDDLHAAMQKVAHDPARREQLIAAGYARAASFPWEEAVRKTWNVYRELL